MNPGPVPARRLRIAVLNRVFSSAGGGAETYSIRLVEQLAQRHEIHVFAQEISHSWAGVTYHRVPLLARKPRWLNQLWYGLHTWWTTRRGFDVVHSHENTWHGLVQTIHVKPTRYNLLHGRTGWRLALRWLKIGTSPRLLTHLFLEGARFRPIAGRRVALASDSLMAQALAMYPDAGAVMSVITPGVILPQAGPQRAEARRLLGLPQSAAVLLFVANDFVRKGLDALLDAMVRLPEGVMLAVVGSSQGLPAYRERVRTLGLAERVYFLGSMPQVDLAYRAASALAHPTLDDTFAMVVLEAMAYGLPVVVSGPAYCGISSRLTHDVDALLIDDPRDARRLAQLLARVLGDPALALALSERARQFAAGHSWDEAARHYEQLYFESLTPRA